MHRFVVAQLGARMHYAVPRILHSAGMLERLYTDIVAPDGWISAVGGSVARSLGVASLKRLMARVPDGVPPERIVQFPGFFLKYHRDQRNARTSSEITASYMRAGGEFCRRIIARGLGGATAVYVFNSAGLELLRFGRERGLATVVEQTSAPWGIYRRFIEDEWAAWPGWEERQTRDLMAGEYAAREREEWRSSDFILCPSDFVLQGIRSDGGPVERCRVVPYGVDVRRGPRLAPSESKLRVLFAGRVGLAKGVQYLFQAARRLSMEHFVFRFVGPLTLSPTAQREIPRNAQAVGPVSRAEMADQYAWADVFVLPSLCEGSATVCYEALAAGLPIVTTPNAGSVVRDGVDGFVVPIRNSEAIAERLELLRSRPEVLAEMSRNALARASVFTLARYSERLISAVTAQSSTADGRRQ